MTHYVRETFFLPPEHAREASALPASIYNALALLLARSGGETLFVPIRSMQYLAVARREEIVFVDSNGGYAYQDGEGGRLIRLAWRPAPAAERTDLNAPVPCEIVHYFPGLEELQRRLVSEIQPALRLLATRGRQAAPAPPGPRVVPLRRD